MTKRRRTIHAQFTAIIGLAFAAGTLAAAEGRAEPSAARGVIKAKAEAAIAVDFSARVERLPFREGERFAKGDVLLAFDCARQRADVEAARAGLSAAEIELQNSRRLLKRGAAAANEVELLAAKAARSRGEWKSAAARIAHCQILAPYPGRMADWLVQPHETPAASQPLFKIVDDTALELEIIAPSRWLTWLKPGEAFEFTVDETGETRKGEVARLGAAVDPVSQTVEIYGVLLEKSASVLPGMSGTATFPAGPGS